MGLRRRDLLKVVGTSIAGAAATKLTAKDASAASSETIVRDVCVIGGGSAGTYTAVRLKDFGKSVVVLEAKDHLGGHAETIQNAQTGNVPIDIGVVVFENNPLVTAYLNRFNVPYIPIAFPPGQTAYVDFRTGKTVNYTPPSQVALGTALFTYLTILQTQFPYLDSGFNLPNPVPQDLLLPFGEFVTKYNLGALVNTAFAFGQGLGNLLQDPALYVLKNFSLSVAGTLAQGQFLLLPLGTSSLNTAAAASLGTDVVYNSEVLQVVRGPNGVTVFVETPAGLRTVQAKRLVIAIPPTLGNLAPFELDVTEADLFSRLCTQYYGTALVKLGGLPPGLTVQNVAAETPYNLPPLPGIYALDPTQAPGLWNLKYGGVGDIPMPAVEARIIADIQRINRAGTFPVTFGGFVAFSSHVPFEMMVSSADIAGGYYTRLNGLQGHRETFYTGATFQTNDSSLIWQFTEGLLPQITA